MEMKRRFAKAVIVVVFLFVASYPTPVLADNVVPIVNQPLVPGFAKPGGKAFTLIVNGTGFVSGATVDWNGSPRTTTFVSSSQLTAAISAADIALASTVSVTVVNPPPGGGVSNSMLFLVTTTVPSILLAETDYLTGSRSQAIAAADFNGDSKLDMAVGNLDSATVSIFLGNGDGTFKAHVDFATGLYPNGLIVRDFNGDGKPDVATANGSGTVSILLGNGDGSFQQPVEYAVGPGAFSLAAGDFNGDGKLDLAVANNNGNLNGTVSILLGNGDGTFESHVDYSVGNGPYSVAVGDFNRDGNLDLVVVNYVSFTASVLLGNGDGTFQRQVTYGVGTQPDSVAVADFNGDGILDLAVLNFYDGAVSILLGKGDGTFQPQVSYPAGRVPSSLVIGDFNGDGKLDIVTSNYAPGGYTVPPGYINILIGNGDGTFQAPEAFLGGPNPATVIAADLNNDGTLDFITGSVSVPGAATFSVLPQVPKVHLSSSSLTFPPQWVKTTSSVQNLTLTNTGSAPLAISSIAVNGDFTQNNGLAAGSSCAISIAFTPTVSGTRSAVVTVTDNATGSPHTLPVSGTGTDFSATVAQGTQTTATIVAGESATYNLVLEGTPGFTGTVSLSCAGVPSLSTCAVAPALLSLSGTAPLNTTVSVSTTGRGMSTPHLPPQPPAPPLPAVLLVAMAAFLANGFFSLLGGQRGLGRSHAKLPTVLLFVTMLATGVITSCGGARGTGTPSGTYSLTVTATAASGSARLTHTVAVTLTVR